VGCHWCDVKESWDPDLHPLTSVHTIVDHALEHPAKAVVITGGEPSTYPLAPLTNALKAKGFQTFIETSGAYPLSGTWDWICLSPKKTARPQEEILQRANELKVIIYNEDDFKWADEFRLKMNPSCFLYLQPEWSRSEKMLNRIIEYVKEHPHWMISLQTHKFMNIP
jgi:7-carboxy-7-deazaguanine synthase